MYIELHAPPEHIDNGIDKLEKILSKIYFPKDLPEGLYGSIRLRKA